MGSYFVTKTANGWRLRAVTNCGKKKTWRHVPPDSQEAKLLGLTPALTFEEAKARIATHRADRKIQSQTERRKRLDARLAQDHLVSSAWLPADIVQEFEQNVMPDENIPERHWRAVRRLIADVNLPPSEWRFRKKAVWSWFKVKGYSPDYTWRLLRIANLYQTLYCARREKAWSNLPMPEGPALVAIRVENRRARQGRQETFPLTLELLAVAKVKLDPTEYAWEAVSVWFGLRVEEMGALTPANRGILWDVRQDDPRFPVLWVLQQKLVRDGVPEEEAWKAIPVCEPEQVALLPTIEAGSHKRPTYLRLKRLVHPRLSYRSGRAYFVTLMHEKRGYPEAVCSKWLGHRGLATTRTSYERPKAVYYEPPVRTKKAG